MDDLVLRDRDATGGGTLNEQLYALQDRNGNVTALADTTGAVQERYGYDGYGLPAVLTAGFGLRLSSLYDWETRFGGYRFDAESGLYCVRRRCYHALLGCWLQRDPLGLAAGRNLYEYAAGSPVNHTDPSGEAISLFLVLVALVVGAASAASAGYAASRVTRNRNAIALAAGWGFAVGVLTVLSLGAAGGAAGGGFAALRFAAIGGQSAVGVTFSYAAAQAALIATGVVACAALIATLTEGGGEGNGNGEDFDECEGTVLDDCTLGRFCRHSGVYGPCKIIRLFSDLPGFCGCSLKYPPLLLLGD